MDKFIHDYLKYLIDNEKFYMTQYYSEFYKVHKYIAVKDVDGKLYCVIITDEKDENINIDESLRHLMSLNKVFALNVMVMADNEYVNTSLYNVNKIIVNKTNFSVISFDRACSPLAQICNTVFVRKYSSQKRQMKNLLEYKIPTLVIIAINVVMFIISYYLIQRGLNSMAQLQQVKASNLPQGLVNMINNTVLIKLGAKYSPLIYSGEIWRLLTCAFLHGSILHIACNMYMLYIVGPQIQRIFGTVKYLIIYFISCITSSYLSMIINPDVISVGASGGIFGLMGALLAFAVIERKNINKEYTMGLIKTVVINLVIGLIVINIDNAAHIGGFIGGSLIGALLYLVKGKKFFKR